MYIAIISFSCLNKRATTPVSVKYCEGIPFPEEAEALKKASDFVLLNDLFKHEMP
jgi:hypothetical protein